MQFLQLSWNVGNQLNPVKNSLLEEAMSLLKLMLSSEFLPSALTVLSLFNVCMILVLVCQCSKIVFMCGASLAS